MQNEASFSQFHELNLPGSLITTDWLAENLYHPNLVVLDASMRPAGAVDTNSGITTYPRIPGARIFDFDKKICDRSSPLPHMMPSPEFFEQEVRALGINPESQIVIYDKVGVYSSPRARWMFKAMGHDQVAVLNGGLPEWISAGHPIEASSENQNELGRFVAHPRPYMFCDADYVLNALNDSSLIVLDARSKTRFDGKDPEPRSGLRSGHMPNSINLPFGTVESNSRMRSSIELKQIFSPLIGSGQKIIATCGSGVTACIIAFAAELSGYTNITVYDGSWSEWGQPSSRPVV